MPRTFETLNLHSLEHVVGGLELDEYGNPIPDGLDMPWDDFGLIDEGDGGDSGDGSGFDDGGFPTGIDLSDVGDGPSDEEIFQNQLDIAQHYWDGASPPVLSQVPGDCYVVSTLNSIASTPEGQHYLASLIDPQEDGSFIVHLTSSTGEDMPVHIPGDAVLGGSQGDPGLQLIELAIGISRGGDDSNPYDTLNQGGRPEDIMSTLGLTSDVTDVMGALGIDSGNGASFVLGTNGDADALSQYGLETNHAYSVTGMMTNPADGQTYLVLSNPWGTSQPAPIPVGELSNLFQSTSIGVLPTTGDNGSSGTNDSSSGGGQ